MSQDKRKVRRPVTIADRDQVDAVDLGEPDAQGAEFFARVDEFACRRGVDTLLTVVRDWLRFQSENFVTATPQEAGYSAASDLVDAAREEIAAHGASTVECGALAQADGAGDD